MHRGEIQSPAGVYDATFLDSALRARVKLVKLLGLMLFICLGLGAAFPEILFKDLSTFAVPAALLMLLGIGPISNVTGQERGRYMAASFAFFLYGAAYVVLSLLGVFNVDSELPLREDYVFRHSYFVFLWVPFLLGGLGFWTSCCSNVTSIFKRYGAYFLVVMIAMDLSTAYLFGDPLTTEWVGYTYYMEKLTFQFLYVLIYLTYLTHSRRWLLCMALISLHAALCVVLKLGIMFNAMTGLLIYVILCASSLPMLSFRTKAIAVVAVYVCLVSQIFVGLLLPGLFDGDENNAWRLMVWRSNLSTLWDTHLLGVGFGTPYFPLTSEMLANTLANRFDSASIPFGDVVEPQYVRAQHSSFINILYRMGLIGGVLFVYLNVLVVQCAYRALKRHDVMAVRISFVGLVLFVVQMLQMTVHVGLETPRYLLLYSLSVALVLYASVFRSAASAPVRAPPPLFSAPAAGLRR